LPQYSSDYNRRWRLRNGWFSFDLIVLLHDEHLIEEYNKYGELRRETRVPPRRRRVSCAKTK